MSNPAEIKAKESAEAIAPTADYYLVLMTTLLEKVGENSSIGVSLNISGGLVTGHLVTHKVWEALWKEQVSQANEWVGGVIARVLEETATDEVEDEAIPVRYIHLKDATFISGSTTSKVGLWRGPLHQVAGWTNSTIAG
ncbi:hypothetical protein PV735_05410 [Streptomyces turgidiscabies]|uniref:Gas vesicle protein n=1 Tax=Streptomyces turgidiscabies (strain Car8) TaxID=698760 RepID=L7EZM2_STRT8|nr:hypothetical protein [Streptomyces turgidiscabies]ELP64146.1 hypothetical protein STRTUCAR8_05565 [Streptomyces turgidiscabies Car8]MDX3492127.1 hypothetical protein [Streptomyces turgidiscabies]